MTALPGLKAIFCEQPGDFDSSECRTLAQSCISLFEVMFERISVYPEANPTSLDPFHVYQPPQFQRHEVLPLHSGPVIL